MAGIVHCAFYGCMSNRRHRELSFFKLPVDEERRKKWLEIIDRTDLIKPDLKPQSYAVCSKHFDKSLITMIPKLKPDALPDRLVRELKACDQATQTKDSFINTLKLGYEAFKPFAEPKTDNQPETTRNSVDSMDDTGNDSDDNEDEPSDTMEKPETNLHELGTTEPEGARSDDEPIVKVEFVIKEEEVDPLEEETAESAFLQNIDELQTCCLVPPPTTCVPLFHLTAPYQSVPSSHISQAFQGVPLTQGVSQSQSDPPAEGVPPSKSVPPTKGGTPSKTVPPPKGVLHSKSVPPPKGVLSPKSVPPPKGVRPSKSLPPPKGVPPSKRKRGDEHCSPTTTHSHKPTPTAEQLTELCKETSLSSRDATSSTSGSKADAKNIVTSWQGVQPDIIKGKESGEFISLYNEYRKHPNKFFEYTRMSVDTFDYILLNIEADIRVQIKCKRAVSPPEKLFLTLRYLGHGTPLRCLAQSYRLGRSTVSKLIYRTLKTIWKRFVHIHMPQPTCEDLKNIANQYYSKWQFPNCFGSIDGKHFRIKPPHSGSESHDNKKYFSLVLQGISDADSKFIAIEIGGKSKQSDGDTFHSSRLNSLLSENKFNVPPPQNLPGSNILLPHVLIGDETYPLKSFLMRPYPSINLNTEKTTFNERLSRARVTIECAFGILTAKFRIFLKRVETNIKHAKLIFNVSSLLHNIIRERDGDRDEDFRKFWANYRNSNTARKKTKSRRNNRATVRVTKIRDQFQHYFVNHPLLE